MNKRSATRPARVRADRTIDCVDPDRRGQLGPGGRAQGATTIDAFGLEATVGAGSDNGTRMRSRGIDAVETRRLDDAGLSQGSSRSVQPKKRRHAVLVPVIVLASLASIWATVKTSESIQEGYDGASYLGAAAELRAGHGPTVPFTDSWNVYAPLDAVALGNHVPSTHFPPGYSLSIAGVSMITGGARSAVRTLGIVGIFVNVTLIGLLIARLTSYRSMTVATIPPALLLLIPEGRSTALGVEPGWLGLHLGSYSEPLFMALTTTALLATGTAVELSKVSTPRARRAAAAATGLAAGALLTRYVGFAVVITVAASLAFLARHASLRTRLLTASGVGLAAVLPTLVFVAWSAASGGGGSGRFLAYHLQGFGGLPDTVGAYFPPSDSVGVLHVAVLLMIAAVLFAALPLSKKLTSPWSDDTRALDLYRVATIFVVAYLGFVIFTRDFLAITTPFDARLLAPIRGIVYAIVIALAFRLLERVASLRVTTGALLLLAVTLVTAGWGRNHNVLDFSAEPRVHDSVTVRAVASLPREAVIVSNVTPAVYLRTGRSAYNLPERTVYMTGSRNQEFDEDLEDWAEVLASRDGYAFLIFPWRPESTTPEDLQRAMSLRLVSRTGNEFLYKVEPKAPSPSN
jgi:hypothetical protein